MGSGAERGSSLLRRAWPRGRTLPYPGLWTPLLGVLVAVAAWNVTFAAPTTGLDPSWWSAMYMAAHRGMHFGSQIVFTYGPLAFLREPWLWYQNLAILGFLYSAALHLALSISLVWALRRTLGAPLAVLLAAIVLLVTPSRDVPLALTAIWCLAALAPEPAPVTRWLLPVGGGMLGAIESLVELRSGPVIWAMCLITLIARRDWRRLVPLFIAVSLCAFAGMWFASGQAVSNLPDYIRNGAQIVSGYSQAMGIQSPSRLASFALPISIAIGLALVAGAVLTSAGVRERVGAGLALAVLAFALYKEAVVRADVDHETILISTAPIVVAGLAFGARRVAVLVAVCAFAALAVVAQPSGSQLNVNPLHHASTTVDQVRLLFNGRQRDRITLFVAIEMLERYRLDKPTLALLKGQTVHIDPWSAAVAWVYGLRWDPLPAFQNYTAYTAALDRLNADALSSASGPTRILRENTALVEQTPAAIDSRVRAWDPPAATLAMICHYVALRTTSRWQVLGKVPDRCGAPRTVKTISAPIGQALVIPPARPGGILYAKVEGFSESGLLDRVRTFLYRSKFLYAVINGGAEHRVVPGTSGDGLLLDAAPGVDYPRPFGLSPGVRTLQFLGLSGQLRITLEWMPVRRR